jgi:hypothetical protein
VERTIPSLVPTVIQAIAGVKLLVLGRSIILPIAIAIIFVCIMLSTVNAMARLTGLGSAPSILFKALALVIFSAGKPKPQGEKSPI